MKRSEVKLRQKVRLIGVLSEPDEYATIYTVKSWVGPFVVSLTYKTETGKTVSGGNMDVSLLRAVKL
jgi:hypothetical protein